MLPIKALVCFLCATAVAGQKPFFLNLDDAESPHFQKPDPPAVQEPAVVPQEQQSFQEPFSWKYPEPPAEEAPRFPPDFQLKTPEPAASVTAVCGENSVRVEANRDLLGIGQLVQPSDVTLGGCPAIGEVPETQVLVFESELHQCNSQLQMTEDTFTYTFVLHYSPSKLGNSPIVRTSDVSVTIQCHYQRKHSVSVGKLTPDWISFSEIKSSEENLYFSLRLLTDDLQFARPSGQFILGDMMKFEASVKQFHHTPLRVTVDSCVATLVPNPDTVPRYTFLGNSGCLYDSQLTGSSSQFLPRAQDDRLMFQLEAFRFQQDSVGQMYITCSLRATTAGAPVDSTTKACSFINGWREASGVHDACSCCDADCGAGLSQVTGNTDTLWKQNAYIGPITVKEKPL
ncbi:zona pellucida sperm-binding protein 3-like [Synchiropus splendidus]|uniref:zona pellucida sperm-binding protein 3-like n=1 Tax=Synchiropus splendidus TaxID=270530 RepID=UPI00237D4074|nr:zona pellucida sperm-binding protein 3-like [Synchiropus splendidus]